MGEDNLLSVVVTDHNRVINLKKALERAGLTKFHLQKCRPYETIPGLKHAIDEIGDTLEIVCETHNLALAQVWIPYEIENHVSSLGYTRTKQLFAVKLIGFQAVLDDVDLMSSITEYHDTCDMFPLKMGEGLIGKTLQTYETLFCRNVGELSDNGLLPLLLAANNKYSCLTICMRSTYTGDLNYGFEFLWPQSHNYSILSKSLLPTLKRCLPSFTCAFDAKLGEELYVPDVHNCTGSIIRCISSLEGQSKTTPISLPREDGKQQFATNMKEAARNYYEPQKRNIQKRKSSDLCRSQTDSTEENSSASSSNSENSHLKSATEKTPHLKIL